MGFQVRKGTKPKIVKQYPFTTERKNKTKNHPQQSSILNSRVSEKKHSSKIRVFIEKTLFQSAIVERVIAASAWLNVVKRTPLRGRGAIPDRNPEELGSRLSGKSA